MSFEVFAYSCRAAAFTAEGEAVLAEYNAFCVYSVIIIRPVRMKIPLVLIRSKYQRKLPLARELFLVASREIEQIYSNLSNLFPICLICTDLYDLTSSTVGSAR